MSNVDEPAFPSLQTFERFNDDLGKYEDYTLPAGGVTKREYFAGLAMQALVSTYTISRDEVTIGTAETAVRYADALLAELEKE